MDYFVKLKLWAWFESYYQPEKLIKNESIDPGFKQRYFKSLFKDLRERGTCAISKFDSVTGRQIYFSDDPNKIL